LAETSGSYCSFLRKANPPLTVHLFLFLNHCPHCGALSHVHLYSPHCLNAGGKGTIIAANGGKWSIYDPLNAASRAARGGDHGACGDDVNKNPGDHAKGGRFYHGGMPVAKYAAGSTIDFEMGITTNHQGYLEWWVCDLDKCGAEDLTTGCFATPGACHRLNRIPHPSCEAGTDMKCGGIHKEYPSRWYLPCRGDPIPTPENIQMLGGPDGRMRYQLPAGFACERCVVQWYWVRVQFRSRVAAVGSLGLTESRAHG